MKNGKITKLFTQNSPDISKLDNSVIKECLITAADSKDYTIQGWTMDAERLKKEGGQ